VTDSQSVIKRSPARKGRAGRKAAPGRKQELLSAARELFLQHGYAGTSVAAIVRAAGVAQGTFYLYFKSKEHLLGRMRADVLGAYVQAFEKNLQGDAPADERLLASIERLLGAMRRHRDLVRVFRQAASGEQTERIWIQGRETLAEPLGSLLQQGIDSGHFVVDDPQMTAYLVLGLFDDLFYEALVYKKPASIGKTQRAAERFLLTALGVQRDRIDALAPGSAQRGAT
jgi:AcrR family transcriptional regulator